MRCSLNGTLYLLFGKGWKVAISFSVFREYYLEGGEREGGRGCVVHFS